MVFASKRKFYMIIRRKFMKALAFILLAGFLLCSCASGDQGSGSGERPTAVITIRCDTAVANGMTLEDKWKGIIPEDGCILSETEVEYSECGILNPCIQAAFFCILSA